LSPAAVFPPITSAGSPADQATSLPWKCSSLFRRLFLEALDAAFQKGDLEFFGELEPLAEAAAFTAFLAPLREAKWVVYSKPPFGGPLQALAYLGRYTHRVAISNHRLVSDEEGRVSFRWKDYRDEDKQKVMEVEADEFIRRFLIHTLPSGFQRIRHFGFMANCHRRAKLDLCRKLLISFIAHLLPQPEACRQMLESITETPVNRCERCGIGTMIRIAVLPHYRWPASPPDSS
jgi:hypothetical protein